MTANIKELVERHMDFITVPLTEKSAERNPGRLCPPGYQLLVTVLVSFFEFVSSCLQIVDCYGSLWGARGRSHWQRMFFSITPILSMDLQNNTVTLMSFTSSGRFTWKTWSCDSLSIDKRQQPTSADSCWRVKCETEEQGAKSWKRE